MGKVSRYGWVRYLGMDGSGIQRDECIRYLGVSALRTKRGESVCRSGGGGGVCMCVCVRVCVFWGGLCHTVGSERVSVRLVLEWKYELGT